MITVLTGSQKIPFNRLVKAVADYAENEGKSERFSIQYGVGECPRSLPNVDSFPFCSQLDVDRLLHESDLVITHGGTGSIIGALEKGIKVLVAPRLKSYGEHNDDHQMEIASSFSSAEFLSIWDSGEPLSAAIERCRNSFFLKYRSGFDEFSKALLRDIDYYLCYKK